MGHGPLVHSPNSPDPGTFPTLSRCMNVNTSPGRSYHRTSFPDSSHSPSRTVVVRFPSIVVRSYLHPLSCHLRSSPVTKEGIIKIWHRFTRKTLGLHSYGKIRRVGVYLVSLLKYDRHPISVWGLVLDVRELGHWIGGTWKGQSKEWQ